MEVRYEDGLGCLVARASGEWAFEEARPQMEALRAEADKRGHTRILADVRDMSPQKSDLNRFYTGEYIAEIFPFRLAVIDDPEYLNGFVENVAVNRFASMAAFSQEEAAIEWLVKGAAV